MQELNRTTNSRMGWLSFLSFFVCISVAGLQLWHLKTFFEKKKLAYISLHRSSFSVFSHVQFSVAVIYNKHFMSKSDDLSYT